MKVFVTDGDQRPALAITRSLGRRGMSVLVGEERPAVWPPRPGTACRHVTYPSPYRIPRPSTVPAGLRRARAGGRRRAGHRRHDPSGRRGIRMRSAVIRLSRLRRSRPSISCQTSGVCCSVPRNAASRSRARTSSMACAGLRPLIAHIDYPAVVKPARSRIPTDAGWLSATVHYAHSESDLLRLYRTTESSDLPSLADPGAHRRAWHRRVRAVRSRPAARRVRAPAAARETTFGRRERPLRERRRSIPQLLRAGDAPARAARLARRGDDGIQAGPSHRTTVPHGSERPVLGIPAARDRRRRRLSVPELPAGAWPAPSTFPRPTRSA